jgi:hypothetical protein
MAFLSNMAQARDVEQYFLIVDAYEQMTVESDGPAATQKIRANLDLSSDAVKSCEDYTGYEASVGTVDPCALSQSFASRSAILR